MTTRTDENKQRAMKDRHTPRHTSYRPTTEKKAGAGTGSWGSVEDFTKNQEDEFFSINQHSTHPKIENIEQNSSPHAISMDDFLPSL